MLMFMLMPDMTPDFTFTRSICFWWRHESRQLGYMGVPSLVFSLGGIPQLQSDWSLSCDHRLDYAS